MNNRIELLCRGMSDGQTAIVSGKPNIYYYSGFTSDDAILFVSKDKRILVTDSRYSIQAREQSPDFDVWDISEGLEKIFKKVGSREYIYEEEMLSAGRFKRYESCAENAKLSFGSEIINEPRKIKDECEVKRIREAERLGDAAFSYILNFMKTGMTEKEVAFEIEFFMRRNGASGLSFETIVASGVRSSMPHGTATDKVIQNGDFVTMDFGCVLDGYCSDMTRTVVMGKCSDRQREIYSVVLKAQKAALEAVKSGKKCSDTDAVAREIIKTAGYGANFGHSLGHSVGIEIHEKPTLSPNSGEFLTDGNVVTIEPGIYIDGFGGVRIEDLVLVKGEKCDNFTNSDKELLII